MNKHSQEFIRDVKRFQGAIQRIKDVRLKRNGNSQEPDYLLAILTRRLVAVSDYAISYSPFTLPEIEKYCRLSQGFGLTTMIRIPDGERTTILNYLDRGANVIQIPDLQTAKESETFVKYFPKLPPG